MSGKRVSTGIAGEHFVAGELAKRDWIVGMTAKNTAGVDLLAQHPRTGRTLSLQVKTRTPAYRYAWRVGTPEKVTTQNFWVLVDLGEMDEIPTHYIIPAAAIAALIRNEQVRTEDAERFRGAWHLLEAAADAQ